MTDLTIPTDGTRTWRTDAIATARFMLVQQWAWSTYYRMDISFEHTEPYTTSGHRSNKVIITCFSLVQSSWMLTHIHQTKNVSPVISLQSVTTESQTSVPRPTSCRPGQLVGRGIQLFEIQALNYLMSPPAMTCPSPQPLCDGLCFAWHTRCLASQRLTYGLHFS